MNTPRDYFADSGAVAPPVFVEGEVKTVGKIPFFRGVFVGGDPAAGKPQQNRLKAKF